jgi:hypothetical protein
MTVGKSNTSLNTYRCMNIAFAAQFGVGNVVGCVGYGTSVIQDGNDAGKNKILKSLNAGCMKSAVTPVGNCVKS